MEAYIPTDNPQNTKYGPVALKAQLSDYWDFGPPPSNYFTKYTENGKGMCYADHSVDNTVRTFKKGAIMTHPCSDNALMQSPIPNVLPERAFYRQSTPGYFDPPVDYIPQQMEWKFHAGGWPFALASQLQLKGIPLSGDHVYRAWDALHKDPQREHEYSQTLWNPGDRESMVFEDEPEAATLARWGFEGRPFSLIIICPLVRADGTGFNRIYDTLNRPPIYARFSVGNQGIYEPLVLMCIPQPVPSDSKGHSYNAVYWYSMKPVPNSNFASVYHTRTRE